MPPTTCRLGASGGLLHQLLRPGAYFSLPASTRVPITDTMSNRLARLTRGFARDWLVPEAAYHTDGFQCDSGLGELGFSRRAPSLGSWPLHYPLHSPVRQLQRPCDLAYTLPGIAKALDLCAVYNDPRPAQCRSFRPSGRQARRDPLFDPSPFKRRHDTVLVWSLDGFSREGIGKTSGHLKRLAKAMLRSVVEARVTTT